MSDVVLILVAVGFFLLVRLGVVGNLQDIVSELHEANELKKREIEQLEMGNN